MKLLRITLFYFFTLIASISVGQTVPLGQLQTYTVVEDFAFNQSGLHPNGSGTLELEETAGTNTLTNSILKFDFNTLPVEAIIVSATLKLTLKSTTTATTDITIERIQEAWTSGSVSWPGPAVHTADAIALTVPVLASGAVQSVDVTKHVQNMSNYSYNNLGWILRLTDQTFTSPDELIEFYPMENATFAPEIEIEYVLPLKITCVPTHNTSSATSSNWDGSVQINLSGGSGEYKVFRLDKVDQLNSSIENTYSVIYSSNNTNTIGTSQFFSSRAPGLYVVSLRDLLYYTSSNTTEEKKAYYTKYLYFVIGQEGAVTSGFIADYRYVGQASIGVNLGTFFPEDYANITYGTTGNPAALRANDSGTNSYGSSTGVAYQSSSFLNLNMYFDPNIEYINPTINFRGWTSFFQTHTSSNAVEYNLVDGTANGHWNPRVVTWNSRPSIITSPNITLPQTATLNGYTPNHTYDAIDISGFIDQWKNPAFENNGIQIGLDDYGLYPTSAGRGYKYMNKNTTYFEFSFTIKEPNTTAYASLNRKLSGSYYHCDIDNLLLHVKYDEEYIDQDGNLSFTIKNSAGINASIPIPQVVYGDNRIDFDVSTLAIGFYILEVRNEKNETFYLRFKKA